MYRLRFFRRALIISVIAHTLAAVGMQAERTTLSTTTDGYWVEQAAQLLRAENYQEALTLCGRWLLSSETQYGEDHPNVALPISCIAQAQALLNNLQAANLMYERAVQVLESGAGVFDERLVATLLGQGKVLLESRNFDGAIAVLSRAKDVSHRNKGIFNTQQTEVVNTLTYAYVLNNEFFRATKEQRFLLHAHEQEYGESPPLLPALRQAANWLGQLKNVQEQRAMYRRALAISEAYFGQNDLRLVEPLRDFAQSYRDTPRVERIMSGDGAKALERVVSIYQNQEFADVADVSGAYLDLGDWYTLAGRRGRAQKAYQNAWATLPDDGQYSTLREQMYGEPVELEYEAAPSLIRHYDALTFPKGDLEIEFDFTVTNTGRVKNVRLFKDEVGSRLLRSDLAENVRRSRYRPRIVDGVPVSTDHVRKIIRLNFEAAARLAPKEPSSDTLPDENQSQEDQETQTQEDQETQTQEQQPLESSDENEAQATPESAVDAEQ